MSLFYSKLLSQGVDVPENPEAFELPAPRVEEGGAGPRDPLSRGGMTEERTAVDAGEGHAREGALALTNEIVDLAAIVSEALVNGVDVLRERLSAHTLPPERAAKAEVLRQ